MAKDKSKVKSLIVESMRENNVQGRSGVLIDAQLNRNNRVFAVKKNPDTRKTFALGNRENMTVRTLGNLQNV